MEKDLHDFEEKWENDDSDFRSACEKAEEAAEVERKFKDVIEWVELNNISPVPATPVACFSFYPIVNLVCVSAQLNMTSISRRI